MHPHAAVRLTLAFLIAMLPACAEQPQRFTDGNVEVVWNRVDNPHKLCEDLSGRREIFQILGCSKWTQPEATGGQRVCSIYAPRPRNERDTQRFATLGHEMMHCFEGNWHDRWGHMIPSEPKLAQKQPDAASGGSASRESATAVE